MNKPWKLILLLVGIFLAGAVAGGFVAERFRRRPSPRRPSSEQAGPERLKLLTEKLGLTPEQQEKLGPIVRRDLQDLARIRNYSMTESRRVFERMDQDISVELTPEQKAKFDDLNRERRERFQRFLREHPPGPGDNPISQQVRPPGATEPPPPTPPADDKPPPEPPKNPPPGGT